VNTEVRERLFAQMRGFMASRILLSAAEVDLFTLLRARSMSANDVCAAIAGDLRAVTILLDALVAMGWLAKTDSRYSTTPDSAALLAGDSPQTLRPMLLHSAGMWERWGLLTEIVRGRASPEPLPMLAEPARLRAFIGGMHVVSRERAPVVVRQVAPASSRALLDIGGASGTYTIEFLRACPAMRATLFDLPAVVELARERLAEEGLLDRVTLVGGDYNRGPFPPGHDLVFLSAIIHQNSPAENISLYKRCRDALIPGGRIVIRDHVLSPDRTTPPAGAMFAVNMLTATSAGNSYTWEEIAGGLTEAGFAGPRLVCQDTVMDGIVEAWKPG
jgi:predicted O-methyltransferase YrrM